MGPPILTQLDGIYKVLASIQSRSHGPTLVPGVLQKTYQITILIWEIIYYSNKMVQGTITLTIQRVINFKDNCNFIRVFILIGVLYVTNS